MKPELLELLYLSFDTELTPQQQDELTQALNQYPELRAEQERLIQLRGSLARSASEFKPFFETRVMERIRSEKPEMVWNLWFDSLWTIFRRVALAGAISAMVLVTINLVSSDELSVGAAFAVQDDPVETIFVTPFEQVME
jgi:hypothetical protein